MHNKILNNSIEISLRLLILLETLNKGVDFQRIIFYDYALLHSGDFDSDQSSLIPPSPFRREELSVKADLIQNALALLSKKQLIDVVFKEKGVFYKRNNLTRLFLRNFTSGYYIKIAEKAKWVKKHFKKYDDQRLKAYFDLSIEQWKSEFSAYGLYSEDFIDAR